MKATYPKGKKLATDLSKILSKDDELVVKSDDNPVFFEYNNKAYYIYLKCVSWGGNPYPENTTRAQLPKRPIFTQIKESDDIFMFWGYDINNQVYVCWDPNVAKSRLNHKNYVSFFSRKIEQEKASEGHPNQATLSNGLRYVCFKTIDAVYFVKNLSVFFQLHLDKQRTDHKDRCVNSKLTVTTHSPILNKVEDDLSVKLLIDNLRDKHCQSLLEIISSAMNSFKSDYQEMNLKNWYHIIKTYLKDNPI